MRNAICLAVLAVSGITGCTNPNAGHGNVKDYLFGRRHGEYLGRDAGDPLLAFAHEITVMEDDLRRDGTITVKTPDVWGDANLVSFIQEYDKEMSRTHDAFKDSLQAYLARSDQAELTATQALGAALGDASVPTVQAQPKDFPDESPFSLIASSSGQAAAAGKFGIEPTESERQHSTYVLVNQALRRRNMGDDNSQMAGYGMYKFRIPVSVLPGRETSQNHAAVVTLRAQLIVDESNLRTTIPRLVVADLVDGLTEPVLADWNKPSKTVEKSEVIAAAKCAFGDLFNILSMIGDQESRSPQSVQDFAALRKANLFGEQWAVVVGQLEKPEEDGIGIVANAVIQLNAFWKEMQQNDTAAASDPMFAQLGECLRRLDGSVQNLEPYARRGGQGNGPDLMDKSATAPIVAGNGRIAFGSASIDAVRSVAQEHFQERTKRKDAPKTQELRTFLFQYLTQLYRTTQARKAFLDQEAAIDAATSDFERGLKIDEYRKAWVTHMQTYCNSADPDTAEVSWLIAMQAGILDHNLKRILEDMRQAGKLSEEAVACSDIVRFYEPDIALEQTLDLWSALVRNEFPLTVFTLDPQVEEQNAYDAFSRRRELQVAMAYGVASGKIRAESALKFSRQVALDSETIALNRTAVGFSHAHDTFGWYFYPRIQSPPTEGTNIGVVARTIWSTGPTEHYDTKHRDLEPGIRECEVIVTMPSFVSRVSFDVTTNWEKLTCPGKTKRSYEEMVAQGSRVQQLHCELQAIHETACNRPGDVARLASRVDQLEHLLGMQTFIVNIPYQYEQSGTDLFDTGDVHLAPVVQDFYGLSYLKSDSDIDAQFFLRGKNFHPTLTHVVVGGAESHSVGNSTSVEVISRELLLVNIKKVQAALSSPTFEVRVGTPAGLSNPVEIPSTPTPPKPAGANFDWSGAPLSFEAELLYDAMADPRVQFVIEDQGTQLSYVAKTPLYSDDIGQNAQMVFLVTAKDSSGEELFARLPSQVFNVVDRKIALCQLASEINRLLNQDARVSTGRIPAVIEVESMIRFDQWPFEELGSAITLRVNRRTSN